MSNGSQHLNFDSTDVIRQLNVCILKAVRHCQHTGYGLIDYWLLTTLFNYTANNVRMTTSNVLEIMSLYQHFTGSLRKTTTKQNDVSLQARFQAEALKISTRL